MEKIHDRSHTLNCNQVPSALLDAGLQNASIFCTREYTNWFSKAINRAASFKSLPTMKLCAQKRIGENVCPGRVFVPTLVKHCCSGKARLIFIPLFSSNEYKL